MLSSRKPHLDTVTNLVSRFTLNASKREKLIFSALVITTLVLSTALAPMPAWIVLFILTSITSVGLTIFSLWGDFARLRYILIPLFPLIFTWSVLLCLSVIPMIQPIKLLIVVVFCITYYLLLLIANIFNVSAIRTIPLMRAAHAASFFLVLVCIFLLQFFVITLKLHPMLLFPLSGSLVFVPALYFFWSLELGAKLSRQVVIESIVIALCTAQVAFVLALWPISPLMYALFLTTIFYVCSGVLHQEYVNKLQRKVLFEYLFVLGFVLLLLMVTAQWGSA